MQMDILLLDTFLGLPCWLLWGLASLLSFLLGLLLGAWLWRRCCVRVGELEVELKRHHDKITDMEKDYMDLKYHHDELQKDNTALRASLNSCEADKAVLAHKLKVAQDAGGPGIVTGSGGPGGKDYATLLGRDNLQIVEGIGPKIEELLKAAGITTWAALAAAPQDKLRQILDDAGPRYRIHDPKSWTEQAKLAEDGKWDELIKYQKFLDAGREDKGDMENPSKVEKLIAKLMGFSNNPEDLKIVEGIGPKIEKLLKDGGIKTWSDLAAAAVDRIQQILDAAGDNYRLADPGTWPKQAELAAAGKWDELAEYQEHLQGGKE